MKLSKTLLTILTPVATISLVAPIASCSKTLEIEFGDSVNCFSNKKPYKEIAKYYKPDEVYHAAQLYAKYISVPGTEVNLTEINSEEEAPLSQYYFDWLCSAYKAGYCFCLETSLNESKTELSTFHFYYQEAKDGKPDPEKELKQLERQGVTRAAFSYVANKEDPTKVDIEIYYGAGGVESFPSYSYQEAIIGE